VILHYGKKSLFWSLKIFGYLSFTTVRGQKIGLNSCVCVDFLNIANFHAFHVWGKHIMLQWHNIFPSLFFLFCYCKATFFHSSFIIKPPQPSSAIYGAPPFTGHISLQLNTIGWSGHETNRICKEIISWGPSVCG